MGSAMVEDDFRVDVVGHASLRVQHAGRTLITDPWLIDPIGCDSGFHFPPVVHDAERLAAETDAIYISHIHPDHFHPPTLALFRKSTPIFIGDYGRKEFRDKVAALGFPVIEVPFQTPITVDGTGIEITLIEHDYEETAAFDSAIVVHTPDFTLFENNDCFLRSNKYSWVHDHFDIDYAFLGYSPASFYPICFEMDDLEKARLLRAAAERRYHDFVDSARILAPRLAVPFASGARFLNPGALWKNASFNTAVEALQRLQGTGIMGAALGPGDRIEADGSLTRRCPVYEDEVAACAAYAEQVKDFVASVQRRLPPARPDLVDRFRDYILRLRRDTRSRLPEVENNVIAYHILDLEPGDFYFDFSHPDEEAFQWGTPPNYDMRYTYPASGLQLVLDGEIDWDQLHFTNDVSVHQINYARPFYQMLRSEMLELG